MKAIQPVINQPPVCQLSQCCMYIASKEDIFLKKKKCCEKFKKKGKRCKGCPGRVD